MDDPRSSRNHSNPWASHPWDFIQWETNDPDDPYNDADHDYDDASDDESGRESRRRSRYRRRRPQRYDGDEDSRSSSLSRSRSRSSSASRYSERSRSPIWRPTSPPFPYEDEDSVASVHNGAVSVRHANLWTSEDEATASSSISSDDGSPLLQPFSADLSSPRTLTPFPPENEGTTGSEDSQVYPPPARRPRLEVISSDEEPIETTEEPDQPLNDVPAWEDVVEYGANYIITNKATYSGGMRYPHPTVPIRPISISLPNGLRFANITITLERSSDGRRMTICGEDEDDYSDWDCSCCGANAETEEETEDDEPDNPRDPDYRPETSDDESDSVICLD